MIVSTYVVDQVISTLIAEVALKTGLGVKREEELV